MPKYLGQNIVNKMYTAIAMCCDRRFLSYKNEFTFSKLIRLIYKETVKLINKYGINECKTMLIELVGILDKLETDGDYCLFYWQNNFKELRKRLAN